VTEEIAQDIDKYIEEVIEQRSLTMDDGRRHGFIPASDPKIEEKPQGPDDGDTLG
jgi:uncharacterized protein YggL (DUF469 family)